MKKLLLPVMLVFSLTSQGKIQNAISSIAFEYHVFKEVYCNMVRSGAFFFNFQK